MTWNEYVMNSNLNQKKQFHFLGGDFYIHNSFQTMCILNAVSKMEYSNNRFFLIKSKCYRISFRCVEMMVALVITKCEFTCKVSHIHISPSLDQFLCLFHIPFNGCQMERSFPTLVSFVHFFVPWRFLNRRNRGLRGGGFG